MALSGGRNAERREPAASLHRRVSSAGRRLLGRRLEAEQLGSDSNSCGTDVQMEAEQRQRQTRGEGEAGRVVAEGGRGLDPR